MSTSHIPTASKQSPSGSGSLQNLALGQSQDQIILLQSIAYSVTQIGDRLQISEERVQGTPANMLPADTISGLPNNSIQNSMQNFSVTT